MVIMKGRSFTNHVGHVAGAAAILYLIDDSISVNGEFNINSYK